MKEPVFTGCAAALVTPFKMGKWTSLPLAGS